MDGSMNCGWCKLYTASGVQVTLPVTPAALDYKAMLANVEAMLAAGFLVSAPGIEPGEHKDDIGYVVRRTKQNEDGSETPILDLYPADEGMVFSKLSVYLNRPEDVAAFEYASGIKLNSIPPYIGTNKIERGANKQTDRLVVKVPKSFKVLWKDNPKYDPNEQDTSKKKPKRLFVRWANQKPAEAQTETPAESARKDMAAAQNLGQLSIVWAELDDDVRREVFADKERRKAELTPSMSQPATAHR